MELFTKQRWIKKGGSKKVRGKHGLRLGEFFYPRVGLMEPAPPSPTLVPGRGVGSRKWEQEIAWRGNWFEKNHRVRVPRG
jgi:hypothetical protein